MASPHVAASAALLFSTCSTCTNTEVRTAMRNSAADLGTTGLDSLFGYGLVDVLQLRPVYLDLQKVALVLLL
jgi:hypothetical protein